MTNWIRSLFFDQPSEGDPPAALVYGEQVRHLYRLSRSGYPGTLITSSLITFALWGLVNHAVLVGWFAAVITVTLVRYGLYRAYRSAPAARVTAQTWADRFQLGAAAMGSLWGFLGTVLFPVGSIPHQFLVIFVIGGMTIAAAVALAPVLRIFYSFTLPALLPLSVVLFMQDERLQILMGALTLVFTVVVLAFALETRYHVLAAIGIKFENAELIRRLSAANEQVRQANTEQERKIASQQRVHEEMQQATQKFQALINASPLAIVLRDPAGLIERWNPAAERIFGWTEAEALGRAVPWHPAGREAEGDRLRNRLLRGETFSGVEAVRLRKDGVPLTVSVSGAPIHDEHGHAIGILTMLVDITSRKQFELRQSSQAAITQLLADSRTVEEALSGIIRIFCRTLGWMCGSRWIFDEQQGVMRCEEAWGTDAPNVQGFLATTRTMLNKRTDATAGVVRRVWDRAAPVWVSNVLEDPGFRRREAASKAGLNAALGFPVMVSDEFYGVLEFFAAGVRPPDPELIEFAGQLGSQIGQFIARKEAEQNLKFVATHDALTQLPNRTMFADRLSQALAQAQRYHRRLAVLFVDLDGFKTVNDTFGHDAGDVLLREVAARLRAGLRAGDVIGRLGGDEFVVLVEEFREPEELTGLASKIVQSIMQPVTVRGLECRVTASVGIAAYPRDGKDSQTLLRNADSAMYRAKEQGKNRFQFYSI